jgi:hypothetical protein
VFRIGTAGHTTVEALTGEYVAVTRSSGPPKYTDRLAVESLRTGKVFRRWSADQVAVRHVVLRPNGALAWSVVSFPTMSGGRTGWLYASDREGMRTLASGADVDTESLARAGRTVYWTQGGKPYSASLH